LGLPRIITAVMGLGGVALIIAAICIVWKFVAPGGAISLARIIWLLVILAAIALLAWLVFRYHRLPLWLIGVRDAPNIPAVPIHLSELPGTVLKLGLRRSQMGQAADALSTVWTIGKHTETAYTFMGMGTPDTKYTQLALDKPEQYAMSWTTLGGIYETATRDQLPQFAAALTDPAEATRQFWPTIARYGLPFNLIFLQYVGPDDQSHKAKLGAAWSPRMEEAHQAGSLYVIDMTFFSQFPAGAVSGQPPRFTPGTETYLVRDPVTRTIAPVGVSVSDSNGNKVTYAEGDPAWLYALAAAKVSMTVWGIWIGHVYQWHIVTAAMQMTMFRILPADHPVRQVFGRQSEYLIAFDQFLLLDWTIAPPTSVTSNAQFITLLDAFAKGRNFFDDDPDMTIKRLGLRVEDFTTKSDVAGNAWDEYPALRYLLMLFHATGQYVAIGLAGRRQRSRASADDDAGRAQAGAHQPDLPRDGARLLAHQPGDQSGDDVPRQLSALPAKHDDPAVRYAVRLQDDIRLTARHAEPCGLPAEYRNDRRADRLRLHVHLHAALHAVHSTRRHRGRFALRGFAGRARPKQSGSDPIPARPEAFPDGVCRRVEGAGSSGAADTMGIEHRNVTMRGPDGRTTRTDP
jgi:hypothetical protein